MDQKTLEALLAEWQPRLGLADWDVVVKLRRIFDLNRSDVAGQCNWTLSNKTALVGVLDPNDYDSDYVRPHDVEKTLVHELLHLHFAPFCEIGAETYQHEQAIEAIARALVGVKRSVEPPSAKARRRP